MAMILIPMIYCSLAYINEYVANVLFGGFETVLVVLFLLVLPVYAPITAIAILIIYIKLFTKEKQIPSFRIQNKFLATNIFYGLAAFIFYVLSFIMIIGVLFTIGQILSVSEGTRVFSNSSIHDIPFVAYTIILILIASRV